MKAKKIVLCYIIIVFYLIPDAGCVRKNEEEFIDALVSMENTAYKHDEVAPEIVDEIKDIVNRYRDELGKEVTDTEELGRLFKRIAQKYMEIGEINKEIQKLAAGGSTRIDSPQEEDIYLKMGVIRYIDGKMYGKAFQNLKRAIEIFPANPVLFYNGGVCAGWIAKSMIEPRYEKERAVWFSTSENYYKRAIELDPVYVDALYGLSVLLVIELDEPLEALPYLERILEKESKHMAARFLLARTYYQIGRYEDAMVQYDEIIKANLSSGMSENARVLKERIKEEVYGLQ
jgi:tetratricopeptide (TPR) repeat protein